MGFEMSTPDYAFLKRIGGIINSGESRTLFVHGQIHDLFFAPEVGDDGSYVPLVDFLLAKWGVLRSKLLVVYELNGPIRFLHPEDKTKMSEAWLKWRSGVGANDLAIKKMLATTSARVDFEALGQNFDTTLAKAHDRPSVALEILRQMCVCSRTRRDMKPLLKEDLVIIVEGADMLLPQGEIARLSDADRHRVAICRDWFSDPGFMGGDDAVVMFAESSNYVNRRVLNLPQVLKISVDAPDEKVRQHCVQWFQNTNKHAKGLSFWSTLEALGKLTAGLSVHALMQLLIAHSHQGKSITPEDVVLRVEEHIKNQLGEDVVEFKKPSHRLDQVVGYSDLKAFMHKELMPRFRSSGPDALSGAAVCGPIGAGKTFIFEAVAAELGMVVLVLKGIRSKWFGETDVLLERLGRMIGALDKVVIFVDEADTQFGGVGANTHDTERRLTGKIQAMMSDPRLRGNVIWLLMTARIHLLSPDIRRPGRVGDLIIPVLDPMGEDRNDFIRWMVDRVIAGELSEDDMEVLRKTSAGFSAASFASMRSELLAHAHTGRLDLASIKRITDDHIPPAIEKTRRYQTLQALLNCTRRTLLPDPKTDDATRQAWAEEIRVLESQGIS
jgi:hypothetical protein